MAQKVGINIEHFRNYSGRKTMIQTLGENDISTTHRSVVRTFKSKKYQKLQQGLDKTAGENVSDS